MSSNRQQLNSDKTQFIVLGSRPQHPKVKCYSIRLLGIDLPFLQNVTCLGVTLDTELFLVQHARGVTSRCFYQLRQIRAIRKSLTVETSKLIVHAFVNSRLDYCNSILYGVGAVQLRKLQSVQNRAARVIARKRKYDPITSTLRDDLHWLPVESRIRFKQCMLVYKCLHGTAPVYISPRCVSDAVLTANTTSFDLLFVVNWSYP